MSKTTRTRARKKRQERQRFDAAVRKHVAASTHGWPEPITLLPENFVFREGLVPKEFHESPWHFFDDNQDK